MAAQKLIAIKAFCIHHNIPREFILDLHRNEIIELVMVKRTGYIPVKILPELEKIIRLHTELQINIEGIQIVLQLLSDLDKKEAELTRLKNTLAFYFHESVA